MMFRYLFTWELIHEFLALFDLNTSVSYLAFWTFVLKRYTNRGLVSVENLIKFIGVRKSFQDSTVSYIILQKINYNQMACSCGGENGILMDGTRVAMKSVASQLEQAWRVPPADVDLKPMTLPEDIIFLAGCDSTTRALFIRFVLRPKRFDVKKRKTLTNRTSGLTKDEYDDLVSRVGAHSFARAKLLLFLLNEPVTSNNSRLFANERLRNLLAALVSDYPVQSLIPPSCVSLVRSIIQSSNSIVANELSVQTELRHSTPLIFDFLLQVGVSNHLRGLLNAVCDMSVAPSLHNQDQSEIPFTRMYP